MKEKIQQRREVTSPRHYVLPVSLHDVSQAPDGYRKRARKRPLTPPALTFSLLKAQMSRRDRSEHGVAPSSQANALSALTQFMAERGLREGDHVGTTLRASFYKLLGEHAKVLRDQGRPSAYVRNRKTLMGRWRSLVLHLDRCDAAERNSDTPFQDALVDLLNGGASIKKTAKALGMAEATLRRWLRGGLPRPSAISHVRALERHFGQAPGTLVDLLPWNPRASTSPEAAEASTPRIAYRQRLRDQALMPYALKEVSDALKEEWTAFVRHKTAALGAAGLKRARRGKWSLTKHPVSRNSSDNWFATVKTLGGTQYCATADMRWSLLTQYLGWLTLDRDSGGAGMPKPYVQSMAFLLDTSLVLQYVEWRAARSGGALHSGILNILQFVAALCHPKTGYLRQSRTRFACHPAAGNETSWADRCREAFEQARQLEQQVRDNFRCSRDPWEPIAYILSLPNPMSAVKDAISRMNAARPSSGGEAEAIWLRNRLMVKLLASNPLRIKNLELLTVDLTGEDDAAQLRKINGEWRIAIPSEDFKNMAGAARDRVYDMPVRKEVWADLELYLQKYRPLLAGKGNRYLMVSSKSPETPMHSLDRCFQSITRKYFPQCPGVGPHSMRYIVATTILKHRPNAWTEAAFVLHDREETVRAHYAHLSSNDAARWLDSLMEAAMEGM